MKENLDNFLSQKCSKRNDNGFLQVVTPERNLVLQRDKVCYPLLQREQVTVNIWAYTITVFLLNPLKST